MTNPATPPAVPDPAAWARPLYEQEIALLGELAEAGLKVALAIRDEAVGGGGDLTALSNAYARVARAVRLAILLQSKLIKQLQDWDAQGAYRAAGQTDSQRAALADQHKARRDRDYAEHLERLAAESAGRIDHDDIYALVESHPVGELIAMIRQDLGLDPDWPQRTQEALARDNSENGVPGSPFAALTVRNPGTAGDNPHGPPLGRPPDSH